MLLEIFKILPNPIQVFTDPISISVFIIYGTLMAWEAFFPAKELPKINYWKVRGIIAFFAFFLLSTYFPMIWDTYLSAYQLMDLTALGTWGGAAVGIIIYELGIYVWHRSLHSSNTLWKVFHQMHHSSERMDSYGAFYFSPLDTLGFAFIGSLCLVVIAGFTAEAATIILLSTTFFAIFTHSNIRTPHWLGYIIQRPENHALHHAKGIHAYNYCDFPFIDMLFGTFKNLKEPIAETGFYEGASSKVLDMLLFKDISEKQ